MQGERRELAMKKQREMTGIIADILYAAGKVAIQHSVSLLTGLILGPLQKQVAVEVGVIGWTGFQRLWSARKLATVAEDGAFISGPVPLGSAKFAIRKGLPMEGQKRMAVENDPHLVDDFDGEIKEGYGKGQKKLLYTGNAIVKINGKTQVAKVNLHEHRAVRAGLHYDIAFEGVESNTERFEVNIPNGPFKGRYAFLRPQGFEEGQVLITRMKDYGLVDPKPDYNLKSREWLKELESDPSNYIVEQKLDGSLANVIIKDNRAIFRSHRDGGETYYDRLPGIEWLNNNSRLLSNRLLFKGPDQEGTVLKGELVHHEGAAKVSGILNSLPDKSIAYQREHGVVTFHPWDVIKLRGKDISNRPYGERREILEAVVSDVRRFNPNWHVIPAVTDEYTRFYDQIVSDPRGLPYSEGVVVKHANGVSGDSWQKIKLRDTVDVRIIDVLEGSGKYSNSVGRILVETATGRGEVGSLAIPDWQRKQMWIDRARMPGQIIEIKAMGITESGAPRAGVMVRFHPSKSEYSFELLADAIASVDGREATDVLYAMKVANGWRSK